MQIGGMQLDLWITLGGLFAGVVVGLTGMGGAAIVTPMLIFVFGVPAPVTVSTDIVSAALMKPVGAGVHIARRTPHMRIAFWLCAGSIPGVIIGSYFFSQIASSKDGTHTLRVLVGIVLLISVGVSFWKTRLSKYEGRMNRVFLSPKRRAIVAFVGLLVGVMVGITSVGSGTLIAASLIVMFPSMLPSRLVGTDLVQAVPMLAVGAVVHWGLGEIDWVVLVSLLIGQLPGVFIGARISSRYDGQALRLMLLILIAVSGLALVGLPAWLVAIITVAGCLGVGIPIVSQSLRDHREGKDRIAVDEAAEPSGDQAASDTKPATDTKPAP